MIHSILVPLDGSTFGEHALPLAVRIAQRAPANLHLVHVHQPIPPTMVEGVVILDDLEQSLRLEEQAYLTRVVQQIQDKTDVPVTSALVHGDIALAIQEWATAVAADLVVLSTHGRGALGRLWMGSVADELVRHLSMPVLLVRPMEGPADLDNPPTLKNILLPLDGSALAEQMIEPALTLGGLLGASFTLVRVIKPVIRIGYLPEGMRLERVADDLLEQIQVHQKHLRDEAKNYLESVADRMRGRALRVDTRVVIDEQPAQGVLRQAGMLGSNLIALETHGRRGLSRLLLGSVADKIIRGAHVPVLVHRPVDA